MVAQGDADDAEVKTVEVVVEIVAPHADDFHQGFQDEDDQEDFVDDLNLVLEVLESLLRPFERLLLEQLFCPF